MDMTPIEGRNSRTYYRTIWISDIHLGTRGCKADFLLDFLKHTDSDTLYLVGDIVDGWRLRKSWYWPQAHNDVVQKLLRKARKGTKLVYVPGNHDEFLREYTGRHFGGVDVVQDMIHETADGKRLLWFKLDAKGEPYAFGTYDDDVGSLSWPWDVVKDGIHHPRWTSNPEGTWRAALKALEINVPLHESMFARPAP